MKLRLRTKLALLVSGLVLAVMLPLSIYSTRQIIESNRAVLRQRAGSVAKMVAMPEVLNAAFGRTAPLKIYDESLKVAMELERSIAYVVVTDDADRLLAGRVNPALVETEAGADGARVLEALSKGTATGGADVKTLTVEISSEQGGGRKVKVGFDTRPMKRQVWNTAATQAAISVALLILGVAASTALAHGVTRPIRALAEAMGRVQEGDFDARVNVRSRDEIGDLSRNFNFMAEGLSEREWLKNTFSRYVSKQVAEKILRDRYNLNLNGELRRVTVLFADIRGFTTLAEQLSPREVVSLLNEYFEVMIDAVFKHDGTLDKFVGDQIMAVFGAPLDQNEAEMRAVQTALDMQAAITRLNETRARQGRPLIQVGIGINTGEAIAGNVGSEKRMEYTVIGDEVNLAERIEATSPRGQILISESTYEAVSDRIAAEKLEPIAVKGKGTPVQLYAVRGLRTADES